MAQNTAAARRQEAERGELVKLPAELVEQFARMAMVIPETESDGGASIIEGILNTADVQDLDAAWDTKDPEKLCGEWLIFEDVSRSVSDYEDGLGVFLVVTAVREDTGERLTFTTGSIAVVAQLVKAYTMDAFPMRAKMMMAEKPTKSGYRPMHLVVHPTQPSK